jgi:hypothetical protein
MSCLPDAAQDLYAVDNGVWQNNKREGHYRVLFGTLNIHVYIYIYIVGGTRWRSWLRHCATNRKVAGSIPDGVIGIFH